MVVARHEEKGDVLPGHMLTLCVMCVRSLYWLTSIFSALHWSKLQILQQPIIQISEICEISSGRSSKILSDSEFVCLVRIETLEHITVSASVEQMQKFGMLRIETLFLYIVSYIWRPDKIVHWFRMRNWRDLLFRSMFKGKL